MDGPRSFIQADNRGAVDVDLLRQSTRPLKVQNRNFSEGFPEATIRKGADQLTLRADEVRTLRAFITQTKLSLSGGDRRWLMRTGTLSVKPFTKELKGKNGKS